MKIPDLVAARIELHVAQKRVELEEVKAQLEAERILNARGRVLRAKRDRLAEELKAWEYLAGFALLRTPMMDPGRCNVCDHLSHSAGVCDVVACRCNLRDTVPEPVPSAGCTDCIHAPHAGGGCPAGTCGCVVVLTPTDRIGCDQCGHDHRQGARCGMLIETEARRMSCGCTS